MKRENSSIRETYNWKCREREITLGKKTLIMGILNVTPDSFSDGGLFFKKKEAVSRAMKMIEEGADIIDVGGESSRPGASTVSEKEELLRTIPIIKKIRKESPDILISIDTTKASVAQKAMEEGADIINDISATSNDTNMPKVATDYQAGLILMHMQGSPKTMQRKPKYDDVVYDVKSYLFQKMNDLSERGLDRSTMVIDPGIGFGKNLDHNLRLLKNAYEFSSKAPVLLGVSRKKFIGLLMNEKNPNDRLFGSLGAAAYGISKGAHILRVHDVLETCALCQLMDTLLLGDNDAVA